MKSVPLGRDLVLSLLWPSSVPRKDPRWGLGGRREIPLLNYIHSEFSLNDRKLGQDEKC
jgi:hypothetical protein